MKIPGDRYVIAVSAGNNYTAAITKDRMLYTWGLNTNGRLGQNNPTFSDCALTPAPILSNARKVSLGDTHAAAVTNDGSVFIWGGNYADQLGPIIEVGKAETKDNVLEPKKLVLQSKEENRELKAIDVSTGYMWTAALTEDHDLYTWGRNNRDALGTGSTEQYITTPQRIKEHVISMDVAYEHGAAITEDHTLYTWGYGSDGELGQEGTARSKTPAPVRSDIKFSIISCSSNHSAAMDEYCNLWTWGFNKSGQMAYSGSSSNKPLNIMNLFTIVNTYKQAVETGNSERFVRTQTFQYYLSLFGGEKGGAGGKLRE